MCSIVSVGREAVVAINPSDQESEGASRENGFTRTFKRALAMALLESQVLRTFALGVTFAAATIITAIAGLYFYFTYGTQFALVPLTALVMAAGISIYEFSMRRVINTHIQRGTSVPSWVWYANSCAEVTAMSALIFILQPGFSNPIYGLSAPPFVAYFFFVILSTLYLNARLSIFTGGLAAAQYLLIVIITFIRYGSDATGDVVFLTPILYLGKACVLLVAGYGAAFVARELSRHQIASLRAVEERNREHLANTQKSQFLADMSHEIRTPLNAVIGYAQLLETETGFSADQRKAVEAIRVGGRHLLSVVNGVLDISKIEAGGEKLVSSRFSLLALLQELTVIFAARCAEKRLSWIFDAANDVGDVVGDEAKLRQVLTNILGNAVKFTDSGSVTLRVSRKDNDHYIFEVIDTGPGIPEDQQSVVFDPFTQNVQGRNNGGTGLGLAIAQRYVRLMNGQLTVSSDAGGGACFRFEISLLDGDVVDASADMSLLAEYKHLATGQTVLALVADDVEENRDILRRMLEQAGVTVCIAENGVQALAAIEQQPIDIAFLDIRMPDLSGTEVARQITKNGREKIKLVAVSASALAHQQAEYLSAGFDEFIDKPVQMRNLYGCISRLLNVSFDAGARPVLKSEEYQSFILPDVLRKSLVDAAEQQNITDLKRHIAEVEALGHQERVFAAQLRDLSARYDMTGILAALEKQDHD